MAKPSAIKPIARTKHTFGLLYGDAGTGKTRLLGTNEGATLIIRPPTEHTDSIRTPDGVEEWVVDGWREMNEVEEFLRHEGGKHYGKANGGLVALDSISLFQDTGMDEIWAEVIAAKPHRAQYGLDKGEYGVNMTRLARLIRSIVGIDQFDFWVTAHPQEMEDPLTGELKIQPYVQGKNMTTKIQGYMNLVGYLEKKYQGTGDEKKLVRVMRTEGSDKYVAKDQFDAFPNSRLVNPTMPKIQQAITAAQASTAKPTARKTTTTKKRTATRRKRTTS